MMPVKYQLRAAHDDVSTHHAKTERIWGQPESKGIWLEALPVQLTGSSLHGKLQVDDIPHPFHTKETLADYWYAPKIFIIQSITIDHPASVMRYGLRIGEKNYHTFSSVDGLHICGIGQEYERGLSLMAPQYFSIYTDSEQHFIATMHGLFLREIC